MEYDICKSCGNARHLLDSGICPNCASWDEYLTIDESKRFVCDGVAYYIADEDVKPAGYGGAKFLIKFTNGAIIRTNNLRHAGDVPPRLARKLENNATFLLDSEEGNPAIHHIIHGIEYPFDGIRHDSKSEICARAILSDLCDRRGIKQALESVDKEVRAEIVQDLAKIVESMFEH